MLFALAHAFIVIMRHGFGRDELFGLARLFHLNEERNIPTMFSLGMLVCCAAVAAFAAPDARNRGEPGGWYWRGLALGFAFMALDEELSIHEVVGQNLQPVLGTSGLLYYAWVVPYGLIAATVGLLYLRFLLRLPRATAARFIAAGAVFVGGAIGVELFQGHFQEAYGFDSLPMATSFVVEEGMEMFGAAFFLYAVLRFLQERSAHLRIHVRSDFAIGSAARHSAR